MPYIRHMVTAHTSQLVNDANWMHRKKRKMAFEFKHEEKNADRPNRVTVSEIPAELSAALEREWVAMQQAITEGKAPYDLVLGMDTPKNVALTAAHARAWGIARGQGNNDVRRVEVRKLPPRKSDGTPEQQALILRLSLTKFDPSAPKLGRKTNDAKATDNANAPKGNGKADAKATK
jgi:hypothetical protein